MYKVNGEQCKKCGKLFHLDAKVFRPIDSNGNPLEIELCDDCEWDNMVEDVMKARHINKKEAEKFIYDKMHKALLDEEILRRIKPNNHDDVVEYNNYWVEQTKNKPPRAVELWNMTSSMLKDEMLNAVVKVVKDNE